MQERLKKLTTLSLPENPPLVIFVYTPTPYIRVLWGDHYSMPSCAQPSPEYGRVLAFVRYIRLGQIPSMVAILKVFLDEDNCDNPEDIGLYQVIMHLTPETPRLPPETGNPDRFCFLLASLDLVSLIHLILASPFLLSASVWHLIYTGV